MLHLIDHFERGWHFDPLLSQNAEDLPSKSPLAEGTLERTHNLNACFSGCLPMEVLPGNATAPEVTEWRGLEEAAIYSILEEAYTLGESLRCVFQGFLPLYSLYQSHFLLQQSSALAKREFELHL